MCGFVDRDAERASAVGEYAGQPLKASCASYAVGSLRLLCAVDKTSPQGFS